MQNETDVIIVGAGISGLYAAKKLLQAGKRVLILEARDRAGGRIHSIREPFSEMTELGAEFIHGKAKITHSLLKMINADIAEKRGKIYRSEKGLVSEMENFIGDEKKLRKKFRKLKSDMTFADFLDDNFVDEEDDNLRENVVNVAQGFDAADIEKLSTKSVKEEWGGGGLEKPERILQGYGALIDYLLDDFREKGGCIWTETIVKEVEWTRNVVRIATSGEYFFEAKQALFTVPLGILALYPGAESYIDFFPEIPGKREAAAKIGYGTVIKANFEFTSAFWEDKNFSEKCLQIKELGFLANDSDFPKWWTGDPAKPFLTAWVGGTPAAEMKNMSDEILMEKAIDSLAACFQCSRNFLKAQLKVAKITNWGADKFSLGAYSYETMDASAARKILKEPLDKTLFFAGEALGDEMGTVESALSSAAFAVKQMLQS